MNFLNKGIELSFEQTKELPDKTKIYVESTFPEDHSFIGIKKENKIFTPWGQYWILGADFKDLCSVYEYNDTIIHS